MDNLQMSRFISEIKAKWRCGRAYQKKLLQLTGIRDQAYETKAEGTEGHACDNKPLQSHL